MQIISKIKFIPRYLPPIKYFIPKNLKEIHNKLPSRRISRYKRDINTDRRHENWSTRSHAKRRWFPVLSSDLNASRWKNGHSLSRLCARFMGRPIFAFNPKSPPIDRRRWKRWPLLEYDTLHIQCTAPVYIRMERNIYEPMGGHIDGQPVWKYFTPRDVIYNFITGSIYTRWCSR